MNEFRSMERPIGPCDASGVELRGSRRASVAGVVLALLLLALPTCADQPTDVPPPANASQQPTTFDGQLQCSAGEEDGAVEWDYGANPKGTIEDPVRWFRDNALGLDPKLMLSFVEEFRGSPDTLDNVVMARSEDGRVVAFLEFGRDVNGRYFSLRRAPRSEGEVGHMGHPGALSETRRNSCWPPPPVLPCSTAWMRYLPG
jgi:hypothetical protein